MGIVRVELAVTGGTGWFISMSRRTLSEEEDVYSFTVLHSIDFLFLLCTVCVVSSLSPLLHPTLYLSQVNIPYNASLSPGCWLIFPPSSPLVCSTIIRQVVQGGRSKLLLENAAVVGQLVRLATAGLEREPSWKIWPIFLTIPPLVFPVKWQTRSLSSITSKGATKYKGGCTLMLQSHLYSAPSHILKYFTLWS